jgi:ArsR family transcriptional regulator, arsenate/arsenite/antimonite-responsive transcriptional repressor
MNTKTIDTIEVLKSLADDTRLRMVHLVTAAGDLCACEIEAILGVNQSNASRHLKRLTAAGVLAAERRGLWVHYHPGSVPGAEQIVNPVLISARNDSSILNTDLERLKDYRASGYTCQTISDWRL